MREDEGDANFKKVREIIFREKRSFFRPTIKNLGMHGKTGIVLLPAGIRCSCNGATSIMFLRTAWNGDLRKSETTL